ncbi:26S proteasome non-ATPase regulatory subunit 3-like protein A [Nymphaea thermarum]|nr:26S proteasome non-ATPase regulatory subunit 3-like protein A [Nymphaea thermarum]
MHAAGRSTAKSCASAAVVKLKQLNRRTVDVLAARLCFWGDVYSTNEPRLAFHTRIAFCLNMHNEAVIVSALTFPPNAHNKEKESVEKRRERDSNRNRSLQSISQRRTMMSFRSA